MTNTSGLSAPPMSGAVIERAALNLRRKMFIKDSKSMLDIVMVAETMPDVLGFDFRVLDDANFKNTFGNVEGITALMDKTIFIPESVYEGSIAGIPKDRFTIAHEIGHVVLHFESSTNMPRLSEKQVIKAYEDPEWQANRFAAAILAPPTLHGIYLTVEELMEHCGLSRQSANIRIKHWRGLDKKIVI